MRRSSPTKATMKKKIKVTAAFHAVGAAKGSNRLFIVIILDLLPPSTIAPKVQGTIVQGAEELRILSRVVTPRATISHELTLNHVTRHAAILYSEPQQARAALAFSRW